MSTEDLQIESHPWPPFVPDGARIMILGTFPPGSHRWSMDFYYPNRTNDFWRICGLLFMGNPDALYIKGERRFDEAAIRELMTERRIALGDTARKVRRLKGNASDKFLEILTPIPLADVLDMMPDCHTLATTGEKAASVIADISGTSVPKMGEMVQVENFAGRNLDIWRMPSTSRAFPMRLEQKAEYYKRLFCSAGVL